MPKREPTTCLYYPLIHVRSDTWLKTAALYWDRVDRVLPSQTYPLRDSPSAVCLRNARRLGTRTLYGQKRRLAERFARVCLTDRTVSQFRVALRESWPVDRITACDAPVGSDRRLAYLHRLEMTRELKDTLVKSGLADESRAGDKDWVGLHPSLVALYKMMATLQVADGSCVEMATDQPNLHLAASGISDDVLADHILRATPAQYRLMSGGEITKWVALHAIRVIVPHDLAVIPMERVLRFRDEYEEAFCNFRRAIADLFGDDIWKSAFAGGRGLDLTVRDLYEAKVKPHLDFIDLRMRYELGRTRYAVLSTGRELVDDLVSNWPTSWFEWASTLVPIACRLQQIRGIQAEYAQTQRQIRNEMPFSYLTCARTQLTPRSTLRQVVEAATAIASPWGD